MVRVLITRFKFYSESEEFTFEPNSLTLLRSPSGTGKSTIFEAIYWCLYSSHKKVCPRGMQVTLKNPTIVQIFFDTGLVVTRTKPPDTLEVSNYDDSGKSLHDEHAQYYIDNLFGTKIGFLATSYMRQGCDNPLLELGNAEKVTLLQELTFGRGLEEDTTNNPKIYSSKVEEAIKKVKADVLTLEGKVSGLEECYVAQKKAARSYSKTWKEAYSEPPTPEQIAVLVSKNSEAENEVTKQKKELAKLRKKWIEYNSFVVEKARLEEEKSVLESKAMALPYTNTQLQAQDKWLDLSTKRKIQEEELLSLTLSEEVTSFLDTYTKELSICRKEVVLHKEYVRSVKSAGFEIEDKLSSKIEAEIESINRQLKQEEEEANVRNRYELALKTYLLQKKERETWLKNVAVVKQNNVVLEEAKLEYENYFEHEEVKQLIEIAGIQDSSKNNKAILSTYYNARTNFGSLADKLKEKLHTVKVAATVLKCPECKANLVLQGNSLIKYAQPEDYTQVNEQIRKALKVIITLEDNLRDYQNKKKLPLEVTEEEPPSVGEAPLPPPKVETLTMSGKAALIKRIKVLQSLQSPVLKVLPKILEAYSLIKIEQYLVQENAYEQYKELSKIVQNVVVEEEPLLGVSKKTIQKHLTENKVVATQLKQAITNLQELVEVVMPESKVEDIENGIVIVENSIKKTCAEIEAGKRLVEVSRTEQEVEANKSKVSELTVRHTTLNRLKQIITDTSSQAMEKTTNTINSMLDIIAKCIFDSETTIAVSMFKEMKTKDCMKNQVNIKIVRGCGEEALEYDTCDLSGGELSRLNLALTIALSNAVSSPFLFLDESLSSLNQTLQEKCLLAISDYCPGKTIVNISHGVSEFGHQNILTLVEEDI